MTPSHSEINAVIARFCADTVSEPLNHFTEADLQAELFARLMSFHPQRYPTAVPKGPGSKGTYECGLIHREYGVGGSRRMDLVVLDPKMVRQINTMNMRIRRTPSSRPAYLLPTFGIELGTEKTPNVARHLKGDLAKLAGASKSGRGFLIYFFRDITTADPGTKSREETEAKINRQLRFPLESVVKSGLPSHLRILCFLLRIGRRRSRIWGKCEIFNPRAKKHWWRKINLSNVETEVLQAL